jgi:hypothetical protein
MEVELRCVVWNPCIRDLLNIRYRLRRFLEHVEETLDVVRAWHRLGQDLARQADTIRNGGHTVRLEMTLKTKSANPSRASLPAGFHRTVIADHETGRVLHTERTISAEVAAWNSEVYFGGIDYAPHKLGEQTFWLPSQFCSRDAKNTGRMFAIYSNCHRYTGELKILPGVSFPGAGPEPR